MYLYVLSTNCALTDFHVLIARLYIIAKHRGEDGFFRIAQTEKGPYGLFGILVHGVVPDAARNITGQVLEDESESSGSGESSGDDGLEWWAWLLIALAAVIVIAVVFGCLVGRRRKQK